MSYLQFLITYWDVLLSGTLITLAQAGLSTALAVALSLSAGLMRIAPIRLVRWTATIYVEFFRGTSLLVQLYWIFFVLPLLGVSLDKYTAGFIGVGLNLGAYGAELVRSAILSVPRGQYEAALALNMPSMTRLRRIILPQAIVILLPSAGNLAIELLKATALVSLISVADLMFQVKQINATTFLSAQAFGTALVIYYIIARFIVTPVMRWLEQVMARRMGRA
ncbi:ectoine/hydroxyectoine ABC transporter permease subunit EhuC [Agrobacterium vitis]|uniref:Ectoine/hydroxyectoine ABC transporter permease subunit EhuC n=1 Tax=Agrobacterium vitis TaxID=373 RepID=A0A6L6VJA9_AGRVI|nr:ectoine/hydroxyectoine ABC transporter permease subunit EhuC [Agrobacterium vitis]MUZ75900.1 ectoine/hydroxyectoine ABC transporter permease subunit EhuC [Agrobacterium vitis]